MWPDSLGIDVSRESLDRLERYQALLFKWQKAINLVGPNTLQEASERHFADSAQLSRYIPSGVSSIMDWGSGAGFPGVVLAIMHPKIDFTMVESDERKCQFMRTVSRETSATMRIETRRIEDVVASCDDVPDLITARALKPIKTLLDFAGPLMERRADVKLLLLKGENVSDEVDEARVHYDFDYKAWPSVTNPLASVVFLSDIKIKT